jgi:hypothetical protein
VKVLDFGLAKAFAGEQPELNLSNSPTLSDAATRQGVKDEEASDKNERISKMSQILRHRESGRQ